MITNIKLYKESLVNDSLSLDDCNISKEQIIRAKKYLLDVINYYGIDDGLKQGILYHETNKIKVESIKNNGFTNDFNFFNGFKPDKFDVKYNALGEMVVTINPYDFIDKLYPDPENIEYPGPGKLGKIYNDIQKRISKSKLMNNNISQIEAAYMLNIDLDIFTYLNAESCGYSIQDGCVWYVIHSKIQPNYIKSIYNNL